MFERSTPHEEGTDGRAGFSCPICPAENLPQDVSLCPRCGADLSPLQRIRALPRALAEEGVALARSGDVDSAVERLLGAATLGWQPTLARSVLATILWRAGRREDGIRLLRRTRESDPSDRRVARLAVAAERSLKRQQRRTAIIGGAIAIAVATLGVGLIAVALMYSAGDERTAAEAPRVDGLRGDSSTSGIVAPEVRAPLAALADRLVREQGLSVDRAPDAITITFADGLFGIGSDVLTQESRRRLDSVARALSAEAEPYDVIVAGRTDATPAPPRGRWGSNAVLGLARAHAATEYLLRRTANPEIRWLATSVQEHSPLFANDTQENRRRNRTVTLRAIAAGGSAPR
jgi:flagellar motor protein MotB